MGDFGLKISLPGVDVERAAPEECVIHSGFNSPKLDATKDHFVNFKVSFFNEPPSPSYPGGTVETLIHTYPHDYKYQPQIWVHMDYQASFGAPITTFDTFGPGRAYLGSRSAEDAVYLAVKADTANCYIYVIKTLDDLGLGTGVKNIVGTQHTIRLYIFADEAFPDA